MSEHDERPENPLLPLSGAIGADGVHRTTARVYYADTDFSGVVYHARYLEFLERGRSDFLRLKGVRHNELHGRDASERVAWVVRRMAVDFRQPARIDDVLSVETAVASVWRARIAMRQRILRGADTLIEAEVEAAIVGADGRPRRMPPDWAQAFAAGGA